MTRGFANYVMEQMIEGVTPVPGLIRFMEISSGMLERHLCLYFGLYQRIL
ncbi:MAG: hypothetical protein IPJ03_15370 [Ignavibacteriales bacterium]|nr:hypothetical protein [Ignavibacteriales bacterium]